MTNENVTINGWFQLLNYILDSIYQNMNIGQPVEVSTSHESLLVLRCSTTLLEKEGMKDTTKIEI